MFLSRNSYGSIPARYASWSITCSLAKQVCIAFGARSVDVLNALFSVGVVLPMIRRFGMSYCVPEYVVSAGPLPGVIIGWPTCDSVGVLL